MITLLITTGTFFFAGELGARLMMVILNTLILLITEKFTLMIIFTAIESCSYMQVTVISG
ncbi:MAG: hypothetical protein ACHQF0_08495 [Chitinophagales bacterium]